ncbi:Ubiquitin-associated domain [Sesbania bispinosa]|nr:Ubiquitin-associated domain [Sesbania bispinosa]
MTADGGIFSSLFLVEFLLFLAASKDNRWVSALLTEFGSGSKDVLEDIGHVHREVLWQIALLENKKPGIEEDGACPSDSQQEERDASETEEQRFNSFRQFLDPLLRRRTSGWSVESQFFDLINLYRDLGRSTGSQHRSNSAGPLNLRSSSSNQLHHSGSDENSGTASKKESDKQRSYYTSCCDMGQITFISHYPFVPRVREINRAPASPMDTDDANAKQDDKEDTDNSWIYGSLASYGKLMDHLVTSSFILSSFTKHLLAQPLTNGDMPFPRDAETFVKVLQSTVLKTVLPVWTHPQFVDCSYEFISSVISIIRHVYSGVEIKNVNGSGGARVTGPPPNETTISTIVEMGFSRSRAEEALRQVGSNSVELAMEWLFSHPEDTQEDDELARALAMSLGNSESDTKDVVENDNAQQLEEEMVQLPPIDELLSTCTKLLIKEPLAFPVRDLLVMICSQDDGQHRSKLSHLLLTGSKNVDDIAPNVFGTPTSNDMDIDVSMVKGKGKAVATLSEGNETSNQEASASLAKIVLLRRDAELGSIRGTYQKSPAGLSMGGIFYHILHNFLPYSRNSKKDKKVEGKLDHSAKPDISQPGRMDNIGEMSQSMEMTSQANHDSLQVDQVGSYAVQSYGGSEAVTDDMEHDQDLDGSSAPANEDDYMHENSEDARDLDNGMEIDNSFPNEAFHVMPVEVFGSRRPGRTTSIYSLLGRNGDTTVPSRHPLLVEPSSSFHPSTMQSDNNQQSGGSNTVVPQGLEELLVSQLRRPTHEKTSNQNTAEAGSQGKVETNQAQDSGGARPEIPVDSNAIQEVGTMLAVEMQFEHNDGAVRDVEAVSQESSGSGATFGESLRSLDVEIGSADGHDDGGERQVSVDRIEVGRESLHSVTEVSENSSRDADQDGPAAEQQVNSDAGSGAIDPAFLDALPEELRAEVLSAQQGQAAQPSNVLLTSPDTILANLTPALVAEANMLRERGIISSRRSNGAKVVEADGAPLVDRDALHAMIRLFRVVQPLYKGQLQRLLLNLCAHSETRISLVKILMDLLMLDVRRPVSSYSTVNRHIDYMVVRAMSSSIALSRILETLTYLARNHLYVAKILLQSRLPHSEIREPVNVDNARNKAVMVVEDEINIGESNEGYISIAMLLGLLNQPLYLRSIAHLEQLLNLLDVIIDSAGSKSNSSDKSLTSTTKPSGSSNFYCRDRCEYSFGNLSSELMHLLKSIPPNPHPLVIIWNWSLSEY